MRQVAPVLPTVPSIGGPSLPRPISKVTLFKEGSETGRTQTSSFFFFLSQKLRTSGIVDRQAGFGHVTVLAQSHAMIVVC